MTDADEPLHRGRQWLAELVDALVFLTRLPPALLARWSSTSPDVAAAARMFPVAGAMIGIVAGVVLVVGGRIGLPIFAAAAVAVGATIASTGALHEDGLADTADGFGGGKERTQKLAIMRDHQIGTYGAIALILTLLLRVVLLADIASFSPLAALLVLIGAEAGSRAAMARVWHDLPPARSDGVSAGAGQPSASVSLTAAIAGAAIAVAAMLVAAGPAGALLTVSVAAAAAMVFAELCRIQIGGQTGDTLGATQQITAVTFLAIAAIVL